MVWIYTYSFIHGIIFCFPTMHLWGQEFCFKIAYFININIDMFFVYSPYSPLYHQSTRMPFTIWWASKKHPETRKSWQNYKIYKTSQAIPRFKTHNPRVRLHRLHNVLTLIDSIDLGLLAECWSDSASSTEACSVSTRRSAKVANCGDKEQTSETELGISQRNENFKTCFLIVAVVLIIPRSYTLMFDVLRIHSVTMSKHMGGFRYLMWRFLPT